VVPAARLLARLAFVVLASCAVALSVAGRASAGYGVYPSGQSFAVTANSIGTVGSPATLDLVVFLDSQDSDASIWVSDSPAIGALGTPAGRAVGSCGPATLIPFGEPGKWVCRVPTTLMEPGRTYYWWLDFRRLEPGNSFPVDRISGPFSFSLVLAAPPPPAPPPPPPPPPPPEEPEPPASTKTATSAATLPSSTTFNGRRSIKHTKLTQLVYRTMKRLGVPRQLAFACWARPDWVSVVRAEGAEPETGNTVLLGFWLRRQPRWLHLAPSVCTEVQLLLSTKKPNARRADALATAVHETLHAYGIANEAMTNCLAVQLVPVFGLELGLTRRRATYLGTLARNAVRAGAPRGYWDSRRCRDGGAWDLSDANNL
jgi:hypothetical protein